MLVRILETAKSKLSIESIEFELECASKLDPDAALGKINDVGLKSGCIIQTQVLSEDQLTTGRHCDKPDVMICEIPDQSYDNSFFPIHLACLDHHLTHNLLNRYLSCLDDMKVASRYGQCYRLSMPSTKQGQSVGASSDT